MAETVDGVQPTKVVELKPGNFSTTPDYSTGICRVLTFIRPLDRAGIHVYDSDKDNFNPTPLDADNPEHDGRDWIGYFEPGQAFEREIIDPGGVAVRLVVRGSEEYDDAS